jgi:hypothetical protein
MRTRHSTTTRLPGTLSMTEIALSAIAVLLIGLVGWFVLATPIGAGHSREIRPPHDPRSTARVRD